MHQQARGGLAFQPVFEAGLAEAKLLCRLRCYARVHPFGDEVPGVLLLPLQERFC